MHQAEDNDSKSVLLVIRSLQGGGMEHMTINLANALSRLGHDVSILVLKKRVHLKPDPEVKIYTVDFEKIFRLTIVGAVYDLIARSIGHYWSSAKFLLVSVYFSALFKIWIKIHETKRKQRYNLIIARGYGSFEGLCLFKDPRFIRVLVNALKLTRANTFDKLFFKLSFNNNKVLFNSNVVLNEFIEVCEKTRTTPRFSHVIGNPTDIERIHELSQGNTPFPQPYIVNVGRLENSKNHELLIRSYAKIAGQFNHKLVIVGNGTKLEYLKNLAEQLGLEDRVYFPGWQDNPYPWIKNAELFVLSSEQEGLPNVVIESLVCGTPVVAVKGFGGTTELMRDELQNFVAEATPESLSKKIEKALTSPPVLSSTLTERYDMYEVAKDFLKYSQ